jgi:hypothetical protein
MARRSLAQQMEADAADAVELTDFYFSKTLNFSEASVALIEQFIDDVHYALPDGKTPRNIDLLCCVWGAYIGEVFRRNVGGTWVEWHDQHGEAIALQLNKQTLFPHDKLRKRLVDGPEHNLRDYYQVFRDLMRAGG